jgi:hypothetical protein
MVVERGQAKHISQYETGEVDKLFMDFCRMLDNCSLNHTIDTGYSACDGCQLYKACEGLHSEVCQVCHVRPLSQHDFDYYKAKFKEMKEEM